MFTARIPRANTSLTSSTVKSIDLRKIPGIDGISDISFSPSTMNIGNIKSAGLKLVSLTKDRILSLVRNLLPLCNGNILIYDL